MSHFRCFASHVAFVMLVGAASACRDAPREPAPPEVVASGPAWGTEVEEEGEVASTLHYVDEGCSGQPGCACAGTLRYGQNALAQIGVTEASLTDGTPCVLGDFDGNGVQDAAFLGRAPEAPKDGVTPAVEVRVLLFDALGLRATSALPKRVTALALRKAGDKGGLADRDTMYEPITEGRQLFVLEKGKFELRVPPAP